MAGDKHTIWDAVRELTEEDQGLVKNRPSIELLRAYVANELPAEEAEALREILAVDRASAKNLREILALDRLGEEPEEAILSAAEFARDREILKAKLLESQPDEPPILPVDPGYASLESRFQYFRAATVLLSLGLFSLVIWQVSRPTEPDEVMTIQDHLLMPVESQVRGAEPEEVVLGAGQRFVYLTLTYVGDEAIERVTLRIIDAARPELHSNHELAEVSSGPLMLRLQKDILPEGLTRLELYGDPGQKLLARYEVRVETSPSPGG